MIVTFSRSPSLPGQRPRTVLLAAAQWYLGQNDLETAQAIALLCGASPGAAASYILARQMGGDAPLMAGVVALTTVGSALSIPILLALFHLG
jgi:predicted permease